jgi:ketosteroid isomerase-like protein
MIKTALVALITLQACAFAKTPVLSEQKKINIIRERIKVSNAKNFAAWQAMHDKDACRTAPELVGELCGSANMREGIEELVEAFPDYNLTLVEAYGSGLRLMAKIRAFGTFTGPIAIGDGTIVQPTGKSFSQEWIANITFNKQGKIVRFEEFHDQLDVYVQLGVYGQQ